jgi:hypothetical protein
MRIIDCVQGSEAWLNARTGLPTASEFHCILAKGRDKKADGQKRTDYTIKIASERLTGMPSPNFKSKPTDRGTEMEPFGRAAYELLTGTEVKQVGLGILDDYMAAASPDFLVGEEGGGEIKSVIPAVQLETIINGKVPEEHVAQIQGNIWVFNADWWDFCSFCLEMPERLQLFRLRVKRDQSYIDKLAAEVSRFNEDVERLITLANRVPMSNLEECHVI